MVKSKLYYPSRIYFIYLISLERGNVINCCHSLFVQISKKHLLLNAKKKNSSDFIIVVYLY